MIIPPAIDHDEPVRDSRGLVIAPDHQAWDRRGATLTLAGGHADEAHASGLIQIAGHYLAAPDCEHTAPCHVCGTEQPVVMTSLSAPDYAICPVKDNPACIERGLAKRAAESKQAIGQAPAQKALPGPAKATSSIRTKRRSRPSTARKTILGQAPDKANGDG